MIVVEVLLCFRMFISSEVFVMLCRASRDLMLYKNNTKPQVDFCRSKWACVKCIKCVRWSFLCVCCVNVTSEQVPWAHCVGGLKRWWWKSSRPMCLCVIMKRSDLYHLFLLWRNLLCVLHTNTCTWRTHTHTHKDLSFCSLLLHLFSLEIQKSKSDKNANDKKM